MGKKSNPSKRWLQAEKRLAEFDAKPKVKINVRQLTRPHKDHARRHAERLRIAEESLVLAAEWLAINGITVDNSRCPWVFRRGRKSCTWNPHAARFVIDGEEMHLHDLAQVSLVLCERWGLNP